MDKDTRSLLFEIGVGMIASMFFIVMVVAIALFVTSAKVQELFN